MPASGNVTIGAFGTPVVILDAANAAGAGEWYTIQGKDKTVRINITGTATVQIESRDMDDVIYPVGSAQTALVQVETSFIGDIRANVTSYTSGSVTVEVAT